MVRLNLLHSDPKWRFLQRRKLIRRKLWDKDRDGQQLLAKRQKRAFYLKNKERILSEQAVYRTEHRERLLAGQRERWAANLEENHHKRAEYRKKNVERLRLESRRAHERHREKHLVKMREYRIRNREKLNAIAREWYAKAKECPDTIARVRTNLKQNAARHFFATRAAHLRCRSRSGAERTSISGFDLWCLWKRQRGRCALTGEPLDRAAHVDHVIPVSRGGGSDVTNLRFLSARANLIKRNYTDEELLDFCTAVVLTIGGSHP